MNEVRLITVRESASADLVATGATLAVRIAGQSLLTGSEAFKKASEVASCVAALKECGVSEERVKLLSVSAEVESGILMKSSSATYHLAIECQSIDLLGKILAAVSLQKNAKIVAISWQYHDLTKTKTDVIQRAVRAARATADAIAQSLSAQLSGIHKLSYEVLGLDTELRIAEVAGYALGRAKARAKAQPSLVSLALSHECQLTVKVNAEFTVDAFAPGST